MLLQAIVHRRATPSSSIIAIFRSGFLSRIRTLNSFFGACCLDVKTLTFCQLMGFPYLTTKSEALLQGSRFRKPGFNQDPYSRSDFTGARTALPGELPSGCLPGIPGPCSGIGASCRYQHPFGVLSVFRLK